MCATLAKSRQKLANGSKIGHGASLKGPCVDQVKSAEAAATEKTAALEKKVETLEEELRDKVLIPYAHPRTLNYLPSRELYTLRPTPHTPKKVKRFEKDIRDKLRWGSRLGWGLWVWGLGFGVVESGLGVRGCGWGVGLRVKD
jgi:hypothetical protein